MNLLEKIIENNKDKLNLRKELQFIEQHKIHYGAAITNLWYKQEVASSVDKALKIEFENEEKIILPQVNKKDIIALLSVMPSIISDLSSLVSVNYITAVIVPKFDKNGNFSGEIEGVRYHDFPRKQDHPSRILVGISNGHVIYPSPIPLTVSKDKRAIFHYQVHVFLQEYFHTVLNGLDSLDNKGKNLKIFGKDYKIHELFNEFKELYIKERNNFVSMYAESYSQLLNKYEAEKNPDKFNHALREQMCESFVGYMLNITPNYQGNSDFKTSYLNEWRWINKICKSKIIIK
jgi:hypothetical protein